MDGMTRLREFAATLEPELRDIAGQIEGEANSAGDVSVSAHDLLPDEDREAIAWVREHGGLERVKAQRRESMPRAAYERKKAGFLDHIAECEAALGRRREIISELNHRVCDLTRENAELRKRAMPEGCEWPTVDGKPVDFETGYVPSLGVLEAVSIYSNGACEVMGHDGIIKDVNEIHVVTPKVLDVDGVEIRVGDKLYDTETGCARIVRAINANGTVEFEGHKDSGWFTKFLTHRAPVLAADGEPLREGETVWNIKTGREYVVVEPSYGKTVVVRLAKYDDAEGEQYAPDQLTHERPVTDTWERLEEDAKLSLCEYNLRHKPAVGDGTTLGEDVRVDLVRRAKALAERGE